MPHPADVRTRHRWWGPGPGSGSGPGPRVRCCGRSAVFHSGQVGPRVSVRRAGVPRRAAPPPHAEAAGTPGRSVSRRNRGSRNPVQRLPTAVRIGHVVWPALDDLDPSSTCHFHWLDHDEVGSALCDPVRLRQVLGNLLRNADL